MKVEDMDYVEIGKVPPNSKSVMPSPKNLAERLQKLIEIGRAHV